MKQVLRDFTASAFLIFLEADVDLGKGATSTMKIPAYISDLHQGKRKKAISLTKV